MKKRLVLIGTLSGLAWAALFAQTAALQTNDFHVVTLEEDPPPAVAATNEPPDAAKSAVANVKELKVEGLVIPPSVAQTPTLEAAVRHIVAQAGKQVGTVGTNGIDKLTMPYQQLGDGKTYEVEWRKALRLLLAPVGYNFTEDGELALFGLAAEVDVKHNRLAQERLLANRTPIIFTTNESEAGMELRNAIRDVAMKANVTITMDYMEPQDLRMAMPAAASNAKVSASDVGKAKEKTAAQPVAVKRTQFDTNGQQIEWRTVLREILNPHDYDFIEIGGVVRIAKRAKLAQWEKDEIAKKPLTAKVIRLYHADPEQVVERLLKIKDLLVHPNASIQATRKKDDNTGTVKNLNGRIQTSSGQQSGMSDTTSQLFDKMVRPRTVPGIVVYDIAENLSRIEEKVKLFDIKEKQILIEAILFQLDNDNGENGDMDGIQWEGFENFVPLYGTLGNVAGLPTAFDGLDVDAGFTLAHNNHVWLRTDSFDFKAAIQLIRKRENSKVLANPMLVVGDHSEAAIQVTDVEPIPQVDASTVSSLAGSGISDNVQSSINIQWNMVRSGVLMWVSPEITESGNSVRLTVHPQVIVKGKKIDLAEIDTDESVFQKYPVYNYELKMHEMDTRATVPTGATLLFGGLIDSQEIVKETKVRWLGDIPIIGWLFRSKTTTVVQKNLVIMIRPTILEDVDQTGYETNTLKQVESISANTGREMRPTPNGPYSAKEMAGEINKVFQERVIDAVDGPRENKPQAPLAEEVKPVVEETPAAKGPVDEVPADSEEARPALPASEAPAAEAAQPGGQ